MQRNVFMIFTVQFIEEKWSCEEYRQNETFIFRGRPEDRRGWHPDRLSFWRSRWTERNEWRNCRRPAVTDLPHRFAPRPQPPGPHYANQRLPKRERSDPVDRTGVSLHQPPTDSNAAPPLALRYSLHKTQLLSPARRWVRSTALYIFDLACMQIQIFMPPTHYPPKNTASVTMPSMHPVTWWMNQWYREYFPLYDLIIQ